MYEIAFIAIKGATPGKRLLKLKVTDAKMQSPPGWRGAALRWIPNLTNLVPGIGPFAGLAVGAASGVLIDRDDQGRSLHDRIGSTYVIKTEPK